MSQEIDQSKHEIDDLQVISQDMGDKDYQQVLVQGDVDNDYLKLREANCIDFQTTIMEPTKHCRTIVISVIIICL